MDKKTDVGTAAEYAGTPKGKRIGRVPSMGDIVIVRNTDDNSISPAIVNRVVVNEAHAEIVIPARPGVLAQIIPAEPYSVTVGATVFPAGQNVRYVEDLQFVEDADADRPGFQGPQRLDHKLIAHWPVVEVPTTPSVTPPALKDKDGKVVA